MIVFEPQATRRQKQMAVDTIHGKVIGGSLVPPSWGYYDVQVADDGTGAQLTEAVGLLKTLPQVRFAALIYGNKPDFTPIRIRGMPCSGITIDRVPEIPPGGRPAWLYDDSMQIVGSGRVSKNVISIAFIAGASQEVKQAAIGSICGVVVGGMPQTGLYLVKIPADGTESAVHDAVKKIRAMPGILVAAIYTTSGLAP
jgi:hypothetical protein